jgi:hypothetical protein
MFDTESSGVHALASELGFTTDSQEESSSPEVETESTEAEGETNDENGEGAPNEEGEAGEKPVSEEEAQAPSEEKPAQEEPKLTLKEFQELNAKQVELEAKEKAFTERMSAQEKEFQEKYHAKLQVHDQFDDFLGQLADKDPEFFSLLQAEFADHQKQYSNPVLNQLKAKNEELEKKLDSFLNKASDEVTRTKLDSEMNQIKSTLGKEAEVAGLKVDWSKIEDAWADNPKLDIKKAFYAEYGEALVKASASKAKVQAVTKKIEGKPSVATGGTVTRANSKGSDSVKGMNTFDSIRELAKQVTGKSY